MPKRERYLFVCTNHRPDGHPKGSCGKRGGEAVLDALKEQLFSAGLQKKIRACASGCLDLCEEGVAVLQEPENAVYAGVQVSDAPDIIAAAAEGRTCDRLIGAKTS